MRMRDFTNAGVVRSRGRIEDIKRAVWRQDGFPDSSVGKESACSAGDPGSIPGSGRSSGGRHGNPFQHFCLENPVDRGAWWAIVHGVAKS